MHLIAVPSPRLVGSEVVYDENVEIFDYMSKLGNFTYSLLLIKSKNTAVDIINAVNNGTADVVTISFVKTKERSAGLLFLDTPRAERFFRLVMPIERAVANGSTIWESALAFNEYKVLGIWVWICIGLLLVAMAGFKTFVEGRKGGGSSYVDNLESFLRQFVGQNLEDTADEEKRWFITTLAALTGLMITVFYGGQIMSSTSVTSGWKAPIHSLADMRRHGWKFMNTTLDPQLHSFADKLSIIDPLVYKQFRQVSQQKEGLRLKSKNWRVALNEHLLFRPSFYHSQTRKCNMATIVLRIYLSNGDYLTYPSTIPEFSAFSVGKNNTKLADFLNPLMDQAARFGINDAAKYRYYYKWKPKNFGEKILYHKCEKSDRTRPRQIDYDSPIMLISDIASLLFVACCCFSLSFGLFVSEILLLRTCAKEENSIKVLQYSAEEKFAQNLNELRKKLDSDSLERLFRKLCKSVEEYSDD